MISFKHQITSLVLCSLLLGSCGSTTAPATPEPLTTAPQTTEQGFSNRITALYRQWLTGYRAIHNEILNWQRGQYFLDVWYNNANFSAINILRRLGLISGYQDNFFRPQRTINRAELTKILVLARGARPELADFHDCFTDVRQEWFAPYICYAKTEGWVSGYQDGSFGPDRIVLTVESLKMIIKTFNIPLAEWNTRQRWSHQLDRNAWYAPYLLTALQRHLITEQSLTSGFNHQELTRGQASTLIWNSLSAAVLNTPVPPATVNLPEFTTQLQTWQQQSTTPVTPAAPPTTPTTSAPTTPTTPVTPAASPTPPSTPSTPTPAAGNQTASPTNSTPPQNPPPTPTDPTPPITPTNPTPPTDPGSTTPNQPATPTDPTQPNLSPLSVGCTIPILSDITNHLGGPYVNVTTLLSTGQTSYQYNPSPSDIQLIRQQQVFIFANTGLEPWANELLGEVNKAELTVVDAGQNIQLQTLQTDSELTLYAGETWLDPQSGLLIVDNIVRGLTTAEPRLASYFKQRGEAYKQELQLIDATYRSELQACSNWLIKVGYPDLTYLASRFHFTPYYISQLVRYETDQDTQFDHLTQQLSQDTHRYFLDDHSSPAESTRLQNDYQLQPLPFESGSTTAVYLDLLRQNLPPLRSALECH